MNPFPYLKTTLRKKGMTTPEVIIVCSILCVIASLLVIILNPITGFADAKNAQRWSEVNLLSNALSQYEHDHGGEHPLVISESEVAICRQGVSCSGVDLRFLVPEYLPKLPVDVDSRDPALSGYVVSGRLGSGLVIRAFFAEKGEIIEVIR